MTHPDFATIDSMVGNTMIVFHDIHVANAYCLHQQERGVCGVICRVEDTRTGSGLLVQWRDPIPIADHPRRQAEARWLLEEVLAGRISMPERGVTTDISDQVEARRTATRDQ